MNDDIGQPRRRIERIEDIARSLDETIARRQQNRLDSSV